MRQESDPCSQMGLNLEDLSIKLEAEGMADDRVGFFTGKRTKKQVTGHGYIMLYMSDPMILSS